MYYLMERKGNISVIVLKGSNECDRYLGMGYIKVDEGTYKQMTAKQMELFNQFLSTF